MKGGCIINTLCIYHTRFIMTKLKIFKELLVCLVVVVIIRFIIAKLFQKEFSFCYSILVGIAIYVGGYFTTRKK